MNPSTEDEYLALPLGDNRPSFQKFGNFSASTIQRICNELQLTVWQCGDVEDVWARHPNRQQNLFSGISSFVQPPPPPPPFIISYQMMMVNVNGSLTSLSSCRGFRNYVKAKATEIGITGVIQRYHHNDVRIKFEGTENQVREFIQFLTACRGLGMIEDFDGVSRSSNIVRLYDSFKIITDFSRTVERGGKVLRGQYSDPEHDKLSVYSSDQPYISNYDASI